MNATNWSKYLALAVAGSALLSAPVWAQDAEFGSESEAVPEAGVEAEAAAPIEYTPIGQGESVAEMSQALAEEIAPAKTASEAVMAYLASKEGWSDGYDEENNRIVVTEKISFDVRNPKVSTDFLEMRTEKMSELLIMAKAKIIETIFSKMSASRILDIPGNPIAKQLEKQQKEVNAALADARERLEALGAELNVTSTDKDSLPSPGELVAVISNWILSAEKENLAEKYDAEKKEAFVAAKEAFAQAEADYKELLKAAEAQKATISKELKTGISKVAAMPIYGCTVLQQAESCTEKAGKFRYEMAVVYYWSMEMQRASGAILTGKPVDFKPGKKTIKEWLAAKAANGALSEWLGPRQFIDKNGHMWFIGISAAPCDEDDADQENMNREMAELEASAEVLFSLYADATSSKELNKLMQTKVLADGTKEDQILKDYSKSQGESFKDIMISGLAPLYEGTVQHRPSGLDVQVVVYGIDSSSPKALKDIQAGAHALGIEVNTYQEMERGRAQYMKDSFEASKSNAAARKAGAQKAADEIKDAANKQKKRDNATRVAPKQTAPAKRDSNAGLRTGASMIVDDDDDDDF